MQTNNYPALQELHALRQTLKNAETRIDQIKSQAEAEARSLCPDGGEFTIPDVGTFNLTVTKTFDLTDFHKYKHPLAVLWRKCYPQREKLRAEASALTKEMKGYMDSFVKANTTQDPDDISYTVKVIR